MTSNGETAISDDESDSAGEHVEGAQSNDESLRFCGHWQSKRSITK